MPFSRHEPPSDSLIGQIFEAVVLSRHRDSCDFRLSGGQRVRLYQHDSCAAQDPRLMEHLPQYAERETCRFLITHRRTDNKELLYYANERWAINNPWENLSLKVGDWVQGVVTQLIYGERDMLKGYYLQLDPALHLGQNPNKPLQPDIQVFLPVEELPWQDGSIGNKPRSTSKRLLLEKGDQVAVIVKEIKTLPHYPVGSLLLSMARQDELFWEDANSASVGAWIKERLHQPHLPQYIPAPTDTDSDRILDGYRILLLDDREDSLTALQNILTKNGATVATLQADSHWSGDTLLAELSMQIQRSSPHLVLVDNALPQPNEGFRLLKRLFAEPASEPPLPPCALISSHFLPAEISRIQQALPQISGVLLRPVTLPQLFDLLDGKSVWSKGVQPLSTDKQPDIPENIPHYLAGLVQKGVLDGVLVLAITQGQVHWEMSAGDAPFSVENLQQAVQESDLRLLLDGRLDEITVRDSSNLLGRNLREAVWFRVVLHEGAQIKLLGLGWKSTGHEHLMSVLQETLREKYQKQSWHLWAQHNANFISSGITVHSLIHEYRQYLNQLKTGLDTLSLGISKQKMELVKAIPNTLLQTVHSMTKLTDTLLQGQAQRGAAVYLPDLLDLIDALVRPSAKESCVDFRMMPAPRLSLGINAASLSTPLSNLLFNAFKHHFRQQARKVVLTMQIQQEQETYWLDFQVRDNGGGIATHQVARLFQPGISFAQQTEQRHGIGLWLAKSMAQQIDGDVLLSQNLRGLGTCFTLRIPLGLG